MKRIALITIMMSLLAVGLFAGTTGTITLSGSVTGVLELTVTPASGIGALDLSTTQTDKLIATVLERSNHKSGYKVTLTTANDLQLKGALSGNTDNMPYTLKYNGTDLTFVSKSCDITTATSKTASTGVSKNLTMSYTGNTWMNEDTYSDTLSFNMVIQ